MRTAVALGSNMSDRLENLRAARKAIFDLAEIKPPIVSSAGSTSGSPAHNTVESVNAVVEFDFTGDPSRLLDQLIPIEEALGRKRNHPNNVSRLIDVDLLYCGDQRINGERLQLPHPRLRLREFVLRPLADIRPELRLPGQKKTIQQLLAQVERSGEVIRLSEEW